jgi:hypothetical protein
MELMKKPIGRSILTIFQNSTQQSKIEDKQPVLSEENQK